MRTRRKAAFLFLALFAEFAFSIDAALAHRFNVVLVIPLSTDTSKQGRDIREGFMLATTERDSHPDQDSDGHLGGLDVYVNAVDERGDVISQLEALLAQGEVDIVAAFGSETTVSLIGKFLDGKEVALLLPVQSHLCKSGRSAMAKFVSAYERAYGNKPSCPAAQGYNAARRIDVAVRAQGGVEVTASLLRNFRETADSFVW